MRYLFSTFLLLLFAGNVFAQVADFSRNSPYLLENQGQVSNSDGTPAEQVLFSMNTPGIDFYLTKSGITYVFKHGIEDETPASELFPQDRPATLKEVQWHRVDATPVGASIDKNNIEISYSKTGTVSIFNQLVPQGLEHIRPVESVTFKNIYPGIDWQFVVQKDFLKYNFILHPGADMSQIKMLFEGQDKISLNDNSLLIETSLGVLKENKIESFTSSGENVNVNATLENNILTYQIENAVVLKENESLIIDPPLVWGTYYGGTGNDLAIVMERNNNGYIYVLMEVSSTDFPLLNQGGASYYQGTFGGNTDVGITKFTEDGIRVWSTFYGGTGVDKPNNLFYNGTILLVVGGTSSTDFPTMNSGIPGAYFDGTIGGSQDGFILAFGPLDIRIWATYFGSSTSNSEEKINDCAFDGSRIIVVGSTNSDFTDFPLMPNGSAYYYSTFAATDVFVSEFNTTFALVWSTLIRGNEGDISPYCDIDSSGRLCVVFQTYSTNIPIDNTLPGSFSQPSFAGFVDFGITMFNTSRNIVWSTYYGGTDKDYANDIICDFNDGWLLTGSSSSTAFPVANNISAGFYQPVKGAGTSGDAVILRFGNNGEQLYSSFYGGNYDDAGKGITLDSHKNLYVVGYARSNDLTTYNPMDGSYYDPTFNSTLVSNADEFLLELDSNFNMKWATYMGGEYDEVMTDVRVSPSDHVFAIGYTKSQNHPLFDLTPGTSYYDSQINNNGTGNGNRDAVIMKFIPCPENFNSISGLDSVCYGSADTLVSVGGFTYAWSTGSTNDSLIQTITADTSYIVTATHLWGCVERDTFVVKVKPLPVVTFTGDSSVCLNDSMHLGVSGGVAYLWENGFTTDSIAFLPAASEYLTIDVMNSFGCTVRDSIQTTVYPLPVPLITGDITPCLHDTTSISASGGDTYLWNTSATTAAIDIAWNTTGTFDYYVIATDANSCSDTAFFTATVTNLPEFWLGNDTIICDETTLILDPGIAGASYNWSTGAVTQTLDVTTADTYSLDLADANNCHFADTIVISVQPLPVITFGGSDTTCFESSITISASAPTGTSYLWSNGMTTTSVTFTPTSAGLDTISITVTDALTCAKTDSLEFMVYPLPVPVISGNTDVCKNDTLNLTVSGGTSYIWSNSVAANNAEYSWNTVGSYTVYSVATDIHGCSDTAFHTANVLSLPEFNLGPDTTICDLTSITLTPGITGSSYDWSTGASTQNIVVGTAGSYILQVTGSNGCKYADSILVAIQPYPVISFGGDSTVCYSHPITITASGGATYVWENGLNGSSITFTPTVSDTLTVVVTDIYSCSSTDSVDFEVLPLPVPSIAGITEICEFDTTTLTASGGVSYQWSTGQSTASADVSPTVAGLMDCYVIATGANGCYDTAYHQITVYALPVIDLGADTSICESTTLILDAGNAGAGFIWNTSDISQTISVSVAGTYAVTVTDSHTCANSDSILIGTTPYADATITDVAFVCVNGSPFEFTAAETGGTWTGDGITNPTTGQFSPAVAGVGPATVVYSIGGMCGDIDSAVIEVGDIPFVQSTVTDETCPDLNDGTLILEISGGSAPYTSDLGGMSISDTTFNIAPGQYILTVTDNRGCASTDSVTILAEDTPCGEVGFYIPNIFSPNGDLENDVLYVRSNFVESLVWHIYDRYGEKVFQSEDINLGWDGKYQGQPVQSGVYYWYIKATMIDGTVIERNGNVTVVH